MKRIFDAAPGIDMLLNAYTEETGVKIGKTINNAIHAWFMPSCTPLAIEAGFLLQRQVEGTLTPWEIEQSVSRGISWLANHPIRDCEILNSITTRFTRISLDAPIKQLGEPTSDLFERVTSKIEAAVPTYKRKQQHYALLAKDICTHWDVLWQDADAYDALSTIVFLNSASPEISWYEGIIYLRNIEIAAIKQYGIL